VHLESFWSFRVGDHKDKILIVGNKRVCETLDLDCGPYDGVYVLEHVHCNYETDNFDLIE
jgi:hypothetical protein